MKLNGRVINPGDLNVKVVLATRDTTKGTGGFAAKTYPFLAQVWARWTNVHGPEAWTADSLGAEAAATLLIRYRSGIDRTCVVVKGATVTDVVDIHGTVTGHTYTGGTVYEIVSLDDIQERHEYIELKVKRLVAG